MMTRKLVRFLSPVVFVVPLLVACDPVPQTPPGVPLMGAPRVPIDKMVAFYRAKAPAGAYRASVSLEDLAAYFAWEGAFENVRGDMAFIQSILETGWFNFPDYGLVHPGDNNFAGIGACDTCSGGLKFASAQLGVRAQIQHLRNYADPLSRASNLHFAPVSPLYSSASSYDSFWRKGKAPVWNLMGGYQPDGYVNWATDSKYGEKIIKLYNDMLRFAGLSGECPPDGLQFGPSAVALRCPASLQHPGRSIAGNPNGGYYSLNGDGTVRAYGNAPYYGSPKFDFDIARDIAVMPDGLGYVVLDGFGGQHRYGSAATRFNGLGGPYWPGFDIARGIAISPTGRGFVILDGYGGLHRFGDAPNVPLPAYWPGWDIARDVEILWDNSTIYVLDGYGAPHKSGPGPGLASPYFNFDIARDMVLIQVPGALYGAYFLDGYGAVHSPSSLLWKQTNSGYAPDDRWHGVAWDMPAAKIVLIKNDGTAKVL